MFDYFRKPKLKEGITTGTFECKRDGLTIRGTEYRPDGEDLPIAIVCHGFMAWQDTVRHAVHLLFKNLARFILACQPTLLPDHTPLWSDASSCGRWEHFTARL